MIENDYECLKDVSSYTPIGFRLSSLSVDIVGLGGEAHESSKVALQCCLAGSFSAWAACCDGIVRHGDFFFQLGTNQIAIKVLKRLPADFGAKEVLFLYCWSRLRWEVERWHAFGDARTVARAARICYPSNYLTLTACTDKRAPAAGPWAVE